MSCPHRTVLVVTPPNDRIRCTTCHLTVKPTELEAGGCPECYERTGRCHDAFEPVESDDSVVMYRCDDCGALLGENEGTENG